jgi:hypothetical protein
MRTICVETIMKLSMYGYHVGAPILSSHATVLARVLNIAPQSCAT